MSSIALLGAKGCGKSALFARFGEQLSRHGHMLLALKADMLPVHIACLRQIDEWLDTPEPLPILLERLAIDTPVTILIDQLDALSELMDVHTERLFALISFIDRVLASPGIKVVVSCREFDAQHDLRLRNLIHNERTTRVKLADLGWKSVDQFLRAKGFRPDNWSTAAKDVLRRPNALKIFVKHFQPHSGKPAFETYQSMLEQVLHESVDRRRFPRTIEALYTLAKELAEREELWIPRAFFEDKFQQEIEHLHATGWLQSTPDGLRMGFAHQTMFDFIRARSFVSQNISLFEEVRVRQNSLAIRPTLSSAASYLRTADRATYQREIGSLLQNREIRPHIKILLIELLGTVADPTPEEASWLRQPLTDEEIRPHIMQAIAKSKPWFALLRTDLIACADLGAHAAYQASWALGEALAFDRLFVLEGLRNSWLKNPDLDNATFNVFRSFEHWDENSASIVETVVGRTSFDPMWVCKIAQSMAATLPQSAIKIVRLQLDRDLQEAISRCAPRPEPLDSSSSVEEQVQNYLATDRAIQPVTALLRNHGDWYELARVAEIAPAELMEGLWTWIEAVSAELAETRQGRTQQYREISEWRFSQDFGSYLTKALWTAAEKFAQTAPDRFLTWVDQSSASQWMPVHQLITHGLIAIGSKRPDAIACYLLGDSRRLAVETRFGKADLSLALLASTASELSQSEADRLRAFIRAWQPFIAPSADREQRVQQWNEDARCRLLSAVDQTGKAPAPPKKNEEEESGFGLVNSPVPTQDLEKMSDQEILALLAQYPDSRTTDIGARQGGTVELGIAFGEFAKKYPQRALEILRQLQPGIQETPAGQGLDAIAKADAVDANRVIELARDLREKGFSSEEFRRRYGWAMVSIANRTNGLDDETIALLLGSLQDPPQQLKQDAETADDQHSPVFRHQEKERKRESILWDMQSGVLPNGNFPFLLAITLGLLRRKPSSYDQLLTILERHLTANEDPRVWEALLDYFKYLGSADRTRLLKLVSDLLQAYPQIFATVEGVRFVAWCHEWFPPDLFENVLTTSENSKWDAAQRAIGELLMLRVALVPNDNLARKRFECALARLGSDTEEIQLGIVRSAAETWIQPRSRDASHHVLLSAIPHTSEDFANAVMFAFSNQSGKRIPLDRYTSELLAKVAESPNLLRVSTTGYLIDRLRELLEDNFSPIEVAKIVLALLEAKGQEIRNGRLAVDTEDLINIALTLQRFPETRAHGTSIFERLLIVNAYKISETARELDRRF
jgi:hypothetical protein